jgi:hypothetical protein
MREDAFEFSGNTPRSASNKTINKTRKNWPSRRNEMNKLMLSIVITIMLVAAGNAQEMPRVLWHNATTGELSAWVLDIHGNVTGTQSLSWRCDAASGCSNNWKVVGTGDFNNNGDTDVLWHNATTGELSVWLLNGAGTVTGTQSLSWRCDAASGCSNSWRVVGTGDFNNTRPVDVLWHNATTGELSVWLLNTSGTVTGTMPLSWKCDAASGCSNNWKAVGILHPFPIIVK